MMEIKPEHKELLKKLGLKEKDFELFDGRQVRYEVDKEKGVRIYDPYYVTSYDEYIASDGWSSWSSENDTFMSDILRDARKKVTEMESRRPRPAEGKITRDLKTKFGETDSSDPEEKDS
jgi:hypothetical protein